jgi:protein-L-isoaspartate(D-aspartate) O-methyltransferase
MSQEPLAAERAALLREIADEVAETRSWLGKDALADAVMAAIGRVPREAFVPPGQRSQAYRNRPLPIGHGQTISQPYMVAVMTDLATGGRAGRVLEIGTGCGYQAAVLAEVAEAVYSVEVVPELAAAAQARLQGLGYDNVHVRTGNGADGWPEHAPYDAVVVTAASGRGVPPALLDQLAPGGRLVIPVESPGSPWTLSFMSTSQHLMVVTRDDSGQVHEEPVLPVAFVPLV